MCGVAVALLAPPSDIAPAEVEGGEEGKSCIDSRPFAPADVESEDVEGVMLVEDPLASATKPEVVVAAEVDEETETELGEGGLPVLLPLLPTSHRPAAPPAAYALLIAEEEGAATAVLSLSLAVSAPKLRRPRCLCCVAPACSAPSPSVVAFDSPIALPLEAAPKKEVEVGAGELVDHPASSKGAILRARILRAAAETCCCCSRCWCCAPLLGRGAEAG